MKNPPYEGRNFQPARDAKNGRLAYTESSTQYKEKTHMARKQFSQIWFTVQAGIFIVIGLLLAGWPNLAYPAFVLNARLLEASLVRMLGVYLASAGLLLWQLRYRPTVAILPLTASGWALVITFIQQTAIWGGPLGWVIVAVLLLLTLGNAAVWWLHRTTYLAWQRPQTTVDYIVALNALLLLVGGVVLTGSPLGNVIGKGLEQGPTGFEILALCRLIGLALSGAGLLALAAFTQPQPKIWQGLLAANLLAFLMASIQQLAIWTNLPGFLVAAGHGAMAVLLLLAWLWDAGGKGRWLPRLKALRQSTAVTLTLYLGGAYLLVAMATIYVHGQLGQIDGFARWVMVLETAVLLGLLLTAPLQQAIYQIEQTVTQLAQQETPLLQAARWPFPNLTAQLDKLNAQMRQSTQLRGQLRQQIRDATAQEERNRLARDLHDSIKQQLFAINVSAAAAQTRWQQDPDGAEAALADVRQSAQAAMVEMNAMLQQLRPSPLENVGLVQALREQGEALALRSGAIVTTDFCELPPPEWWPAGGQTAVFRIAQEALANVARHARASHVALQLSLTGDEQEAGVQLHIVDDGAGFEPAPDGAGMGLENMRVRAQAINADFSVISAPGEGTTVMLDMPLLPYKPAASDPAETTLADLNRMLRNGAVSAAVFALTYALISAGNATTRPFLFTMMTALAFGVITVTILVNNQVQRLPLSASVLLLKGRSYGLRALSLLGLLFVTLSLPLALPQWENAVPAALLGAVLVMAALGATGAHLYQTVQRRYHLLPPGGQSGLLQTVNHWRQVGWMITAVLISNTLISIFFILPSLPPVTTGQWLQSLLIGVTLTTVAVELGLTRLRRNWLRSENDRTQKEAHDD
jgi:signal transduction histidine kinase